VVLAIRSTLAAQRQGLAAAPQRGLRFSVQAPDA
jgi:hypothetical protein